MTLTQLKNQILINRQQLATLYNFKATLKIAKKVYDEHGFTADEYDCHNELKVISKRIAKLVALQQALKLDVRTITHNQRFVAAARKGAM